MATVGEKSLISRRHALINAQKQNYMHTRRTIENNPNETFEGRYFADAQCCIYFECF